MASDVSKKTPADLEKEERDRGLREARTRVPFQPGSNQPPAMTDTQDSDPDIGGGIFGLLAKILKALFTGSFAGALQGLGDIGGSVSSSFSDFTEGLSGRGDTPLAPRGTKQNLGFANSVGTTLRAGMDGVLELIGKHESNGDYNRVYGKGVKRVDLTNMTIDQVQQWQRDYVNAGSPSAAAGKYQIVTNTLAGLEKQMGLTGKEKFDEAMQDRMALQLLENRGINKFKAGTMTTGQIVKEISKEWASISTLNGGGSYDGDGLNMAVRGTGQQMAMLLNGMKDDPNGARSSAARQIDKEQTVAKSASAEMSRAAAAPVDPVADRKTVKIAGGATKFVGSYGEGDDPKLKVASITFAPDSSLSRGLSLNPKV